MESPSPTHYPLLASSRWQLADFVTLEYRKDIGVIIDIGPFSHEPDDTETEQAYDYLKTLALKFLLLSDDPWVLDLDLLCASMPQLADQALAGKLAHEPAFEETTVFVPFYPRYYNKATTMAAGLPPEGERYLRTLFHFPKSSQTNSDATADQFLNFQPSDAVAEESEPDITSDTSDSAPPPDANLSDNGQEENFYYLYSKFMQSQCKEKLQVYVSREHESSAVVDPVHPYDFATTLSGNSFEVKPAAPETGRYLGRISGTLQPQPDGGTLIGANYSVMARKWTTGVWPIFGMTGSVSCMMTAWQAKLLLNSAASETISWTFLMLLGIFGLGISLVSAYNASQERHAAFERDRKPLREFLTKALEAEDVEAK